MRRAVFILLLFLISCSSVLKEKKQEEAFPIPPEKINEKNAGEIAKEAGGNWLYGQGVGETAVAAGGIFVFPPYALYLLGNAALSYSGYEPLYVSDALPENAKASWNNAYENVTSGPGRLNAAIAGKEFRNQELIKERYNELAQKLESEGTVDENTRNSN